MKTILTILLILIFNISESQTLMSWNIQNLGESKYKKDSILIKISKVITSANPDILSIQEVVTSNWGDSCIKKIAKLSNYNYIISSKTTGEGSEKYAFLYKKNVKLLKSYLEINLRDSIDREPFTGIFNINGKNITIRQVHLVPANKNPQYEVSKLYRFKNEDAFICGDFNLTSKHVVFTPILTKMNSVLGEEKSTLKRDGSLSEHSFDHFLVPKKYIIKTKKVFIYAYQGNRNELSDHLPIIISY